MTKWWPHTVPAVYPAGTPEAWDKAHPSAALFIKAAMVGAVAIFASAWVAAGLPGINRDALDSPRFLIPAAVLIGVFGLMVLAWVAIALSWIVEQLQPFERVIEIAVAVVIGGVVLRFLGIL